MTTKDETTGPALRVRRLTETARLPRYAKPGDSGLDLSADCRIPVQIPPGERRAFRTGIAVEIPPGYEGQVRPRSGLAREHGVATFFGTVDAGYRGDVGVTLQNHGDEPFTVEPGDRIAQLVIAPVARCEVVEVDVLGESERGAAGFGSTGLAASDR